jgi:ribosomal protein S18 acetylase RimI-like enzyme
MERLHIDKADINDSTFVAWTVLTALDLNTENITSVAICCKDERSLYSWRKSLVAKIDNQIVGCLVAYDGAEYLHCREYTWPQMWPEISEDEIKNVAIETVPGEYYLDSMAILPEYRSRNIGKILIMEAIKIAKQQNFKKVVLIVDVNKPHLFKYYEIIGFREVGELEFFGHVYKRMCYIV